MALITHHSLSPHLHPLTYEAMLILLYDVDKAEIRTNSVDAGS